MGNLNKQMRPTADFSFIRSGCLLIMLVCNLLSMVWSGAWNSVLCWCLLVSLKVNTQSHRGYLLTSQRRDYEFY